MIRPARKTKAGFSSLVCGVGSKLGKRSQAVLGRQHVFQARWYVTGQAERLNNFVAAWRSMMRRSGLCVRMVSNWKTREMLLRRMPAVIFSAFIVTGLARRCEEPVEGLQLDVRDVWSCF